MASHRPFRVVLKTILILMLVGVLAMGGLIGMIWWKQSHAAPPEHYDAMIVLGAQVKPDGTPSVQLQWRLDKAFEMWEKSPCVIVTCGAQGQNEPMPEGDRMREVLIEMGVPAPMVIAESTSMNTMENLRHAVEILKKYGKKEALIVTSDYHLPRALALAEDFGMTACGIGSPIRPEIQFFLKNYGREALAWVKYWLQKYTPLPV